MSAADWRVMAGLYSRPAVVGYTADAAIWCPSCAQLIYGEDGPIRCDSEGNDVHPVFASDELTPGEVCTRCSEVIA